MTEFYHPLPVQPMIHHTYGVSQVSRPFVMGLTVSPIYEGDVRPSGEIIVSFVEYSG